jgi:hypothetical protein
MKVLEIDKATRPLSDYARKINGEGIIVVQDGTPVAALTPLSDTDLECAQLAMNPKFWEIIERSRESARKHGTIPADEVWAKYADERAGLAHVLPKAEDFAAAFDVIADDIRPNLRKLLLAHHHSPKRTSTAAKLAKAAGYKSWSSANLQYGKLARQVGEVLSFRPSDEYAIAVLVTWKGKSQPSEHLKLIMRPQVAKALEKLGWV